MWEAPVEGGDAMGSVCVHHAEQQQLLCSEEEDEMYFWASSGVYPSSRVSLALSFLPGNKRDFSVSCQGQRRHRAVRGCILHRQSCWGSGRGCAPTSRGLAGAKPLWCMLAIGAARPGEGPAAGSVVWCCWGLWEEGVRGPCQRAAAKLTLLSAHPLLEKLLT